MHSSGLVAFGVLEIAAGAHRRDVEFRHRDRASMSLNGGNGLVDIVHGGPYCVCPPALKKSHKPILLRPISTLPGTGRDR